MFIARHKIAADDVAFATSQYFYSELVMTRRMWRVLRMTTVTDFLSVTSYIREMSTHSLSCDLYHVQLLNQPTLYWTGLCDHPTNLVQFHTYEE